MLPIKLIEAVQRRAVLRRLMQDARTVYAPMDSSPPKEVIECGEIVPVSHNIVTTTMVHDVVAMLAQLVEFQDEEIDKFSVVERVKSKIPRITSAKDAADGTERRKPGRRKKAV